MTIKDKKVLQEVKNAYYGKEYRDSINRSKATRNQIKVLLFLIIIMGLIILVTC
jgi:hypothetical protein